MRGGPRGDTAMRGVEVKHVRRKDVGLERMWDIESATDKGVLDVGHSTTVMRRKAKWPYLYNTGNANDEAPE